MFNFKNLYSFLRIGAENQPLTSDTNRLELVDNVTQRPQLFRHEISDSLTASGKRSLPKNLDSATEIANFSPNDSFQNTDSIGYDLTINQIGRGFSSISYSVTMLSSGYLASHRNPSERIERFRLMDLEQMELVWIPYGNQSNARDIYFQLDGDDGSVWNGQVMDISVLNSSGGSVLNTQRQCFRQINENGSLRWGSATNDGFKLRPNQRGSNESNYLVYLAASNGVISVGQLGMVNFLTGNGIGDRCTSFVGSVESLNQTLDGLQFEPIRNYTGPASLILITNHALI